jgi:Protein of unknown function (DUF1565)
MFLTIGADFGGDLAGSLGGNAFTGNSNHDFVHFAGDGIVLYAAYCFWDHAPPTMTAGLPDPDPTADIWLVTVASNVDAGGAQIFDPVDPPLPPIEL